MAKRVDRRAITVTRNPQQLCLPYLPVSSGETDEVDELVVTNEELDQEELSADE